MESSYSSVLLDAHSGVTQGSVLVRVLVHTKNQFGVNENIFFPYADDVTPLSIFPSRGLRQSVSASRNKVSVYNFYLAPKMEKELESSGD